nr:hypothetical protein [Cytophagales bacterium]
MKLTRIPIQFLLTFFLCLVFATVSQAQTNEALSDYNKDRIALEKKGMMLLATWSVGNIVWGGIGSGRSEGVSKGFHQMNMYWNGVNLIIAGFGYYHAFNEVPGTDFWQTIEAQHGMEKILLLNAGLDIGYIASGLFLNERGKRLGREQWQGFGRSVILQGAFLFGFDVMMYLVMRDHATELPKILEHVSLNGLGMAIRFPL